MKKGAEVEMKTNSQDENLPITLSKKRNYELANIKNILRSLGYRLAIELESST